MPKRRNGLIRSRLFLVGLIVSTVMLPWLEANAQSHPELLQGVTKLATPEQTKEWLTYYYLHPLPDLLPSALDMFSTDGTLQSSEEGAVVAFIVQLCVANPDKVSSWAGIVGRRPEDQRVALESALWIANSVESRLALLQLANAEREQKKKIVTGMLSQTPPDLLRDDIESPAVVGALWGSFYASGDASFVLRVISLLPWINNRLDGTKALIGRTAENSLAVNLVQHPKVMEICESRLTRIPSAERDVLEKIIQRTKEGKH